MKKNFLIILLISILSVNFLMAGENSMNDIKNARMENFLLKIKGGQKVTVAALGGSITTGFNSNPANKNCWASKTRDYLTKLAADNNSEIVFYNQGVSGTDSAFGIARLQDHILSLNPDFVIVEFAMNDQWLDPKVRKRTYEGIMRKLLENPDTAVLALFVNERKSPYSSNQAEQQAVCEYYGIPFVSWKDCLFAENKNASFETYFDGEETVHPNNAGHAKIAEFITAKINEIWNNLPSENNDISKTVLPQPMNKDYFSQIEYYHMDNVEPLSNTGWQKGSPVHSEWVSHGNAHKGWETTEAGSEMTFKFEGKSIGITYCESDQFRDAIAWVTDENGKDGPKVPLICCVSYRKGYYGWAYKELVNSENSQKYTVHVQCSKRAPKTAAGKKCNITGILVSK